MVRTALVWLALLCGAGSAQAIEWKGLFLAGDDSIEAFDNSQRDLHGALLDAQILLDVYLAMTGGQSSLSLGDEQQTGPGGTIKHTLLDRTRGPLRRIQPTPEELQLHRLRLEAINKDSSGKCVWLETGEQ